jgi:hypothetical protein
MVLPGKHYPFHWRERARAGRERCGDCPIISICCECSRGFSLWPNSMSNGGCGRPFAKTWRAQGRDGKLAVLLEDHHLGYISWDDYAFGSFTNSPSTIVSQELLKQTGPSCRGALPFYRQVFTCGGMRIRSSFRRHGTGQILDL